MTNRKNYNSILFLTVYLGLVLVGATPQVLSHAATTRIFDVQTEWEIKDDLDNKPENEGIDYIDNDDFPALLFQLLNDVKAEREKNQTVLQTNFYVDAHYQSFKNSGGGRLGSTISDAKLNLLVQEAFNERFLPKAFEMADFEDQSKDVKIKLEGNQDKIELTLSISKSNPSEFADFLNKKFSLRRVNTESSLAKKIYEKTKVSASNNQIFIVTRLPRASIDSLLK